MKEWRHGAGPWSRDVEMTHLYSTVVFITLKIRLLLKIPQVIEDRHGMNFLLQFLFEGRVWPAFLWTAIGCPDQVQLGTGGLMNQSKCWSHPTLWHATSSQNIFLTSSLLNSTSSAEVTFFSPFPLGSLSNYNSLCLTQDPSIRACVWTLMWLSLLALTRFPPGIPLNSLWGRWKVCLTPGSATEEVYWIVLGALLVPNN